MTTSISLRILLSGILRENCELPIMSPACQFREKCRKREITGEKRRFHSHVCDRPNYVSSQLVLFQHSYDHFDISAYSATCILYHTIPSFAIVFSKFILIKLRANSADRIIRFPLFKSHKTWYNILVSPHMTVNTKHLSIFHPQRRILS